MAENTVDLRTTRISLDEYNMLKDGLNTKNQSIGTLGETILNLRRENEKLQEKQPEVKVVHYENRYDDYDDRIYKEVAKVEFINLTEVERLADNKAKKEVEDKLSTLENSESNLKSEVKNVRSLWETTKDQLGDSKKMIQKLEKQHKEDLDEKTELYNKNVESLKKAQKEDEKEYKDTIKDLKEEIQKVKDDKTQKDIENKRNQEIKDLKGRIKDLEGMIEELGKLNFFKRIFKLRAISAEKLAAQVELEKRERKANAVGTTWISENGKYRKYNKFQDTLDQLFGGSADYYRSMILKARGWF